MLTLKDGGLNHFGAAAEEINGDWELISHHTSGPPLNQRQKFFIDKSLAENFLLRFAHTFLECRYNFTFDILNLN